MTRRSNPETAGHDAAAALDSRSAADLLATPDRLFGLCCGLLRRGDAAANRYLPELERFPEFAQGWVELGATLLELEKPAAAEVAFDYALRTEPDHEMAVLGKADCRLRAGEPGEAAALVETRAPHWRTQAELACLLGRARYAMGELPDAAGAFEAAVRCDPKHAEACFRLGLAEQDLQRWDAAIAAYRSALAARSSMFEAALNLGICLQEVGDIDAAMRAYAKAVRLNPACFNRVAQALTSASSGRLWLRPAALRDALGEISARSG